MALLGLSFPNEQDAAFKAARDFTPLSQKEMQGIEGVSLCAISPGRFTLEILYRGAPETFQDTITSKSFQGFRLDPVNNAVSLPDGRVIELTPIEFRLLHYLARNNGRVLTHEQLLSTVWGYDYEGYSNQVAVYIRRLRSKLEPNPDEPRYILTARGLGYRFEVGGSSG